jgi:hypothetical protein
MCVVIRPKKKHWPSRKSSAALRVCMAKFQLEIGVDTRRIGDACLHLALNFWSNTHEQCFQ